MGARTWRSAGLGLACAAVAVLGCAEPAQVRYERAVEGAPPEAVHAIHSRRLVELMRGLERLRSERLPNAMDVAATEAAREREIAQVGRQLASSAEAISDAAAGLDLSDAERRSFLALADTLEDEAALLAAAPSDSPREVRARADRIEATCAECHRRFRDEGVPAAGSR